MRFARRARPSKASRVDHVRTGAAAMARWHDGRWWWVLPVLAAGVLLIVGGFASTAVAQSATHPYAGSWWLPRDVSADGYRIDRLFTAIFWVTGILFVVMEVALIIFLFAYRQRPGRRAHYLHGNNTLEVVWTAIPAVLFVVLALMSRTVWADLKGNLLVGGDVPANALVVEVTGKQFEWTIRYPGVDGGFQTKDDVVTINQLNLPVGRPIHVRLSSQDVIHSFFVPELRVKQDTVPGMRVYIGFEAKETGNFEIVCSELCGLGHYRMRGFVTIQQPTEFEAWLRENAPAAD
jgi:cytochrome c oxidase subunit 2